MTVRFSGSKTFYCALTACLFPAALMAVDMTTTEITSIEGKVEVKKVADSLFKKLHSNLKLAGSLKRLDGGDKVRTYNQSSAEMALKDTCILAVKEQSIFEVPKTLGEDAVKQLKAQQGALLFKVISGSNFEVQTAEVIAGVKGTLFEVDIIDNFSSILETPGLQLGTLVPGGTTVNVYKGEVELTHKQTGKKRSLKSGEGLAALSAPLMELDKTLQDGFTKLRSFEPAALLGEKFGSDLVGLLNVNSNLSGLTNLGGLGNIQSSLGTNRYSSLLGNDMNLIKGAAQIGGVAGEIVDEALSYGSIIQDLAGEKYKADFSGYSAEKNAFSVSEKSFREVYLGQKTFVACRAAAGSRTAKFEPNREGLLLTEGNSLYRVVRFANTDKTLEFLASYYQNGHNLVTTVNVIKGELYGRIPASLDHFKVPAGEMSFVFDSQTGRGQWLKAASGAIPEETGRHILKIEQKIATEKNNVEHDNKKKKVDAVKKLINIKPGKIFKFR